MEEVNVALEGGAELNADGIPMYGVSSDVCVLLITTSWETGLGGRLACEYVDRPLARPDVDRLAIGDWDKEWSS